MLSLQSENGGQSVSQSPLWIVEMLAHLKTLWEAKQDSEWFSQLGSSWWQNLSVYPLIILTVSMFLSSTLCSLQWDCFIQVNETKIWNTGDTGCCKKFMIASQIWPPQNLCFQESTQIWLPRTFVSRKFLNFGLPKTFVYKKLPNFGSSKN